MAGSEDGAQGGNSAALCKKHEPLPEQRCRTQADCRPGGVCSQTRLAPGCGANMPALRLCESDTDCSMGSICLPQPAQPCTSGTPTACAAACTASSCATDQRCGSNGRCEPLPCNEGFDCGAGRECDPGATGSDVRGCRAKRCESEGHACADDRECDPERDGSDAHGCAPKLCSDGSWTCADGLVCGSPTRADAHGCRCASDAACGVDRVCSAAGYCTARPCQLDDDCECGVCIGGLCAADFYYCSWLAP